MTGPNATQSSRAAWPEGAGATGPGTWASPGESDGQLSQMHGTESPSSRGASGLNGSGDEGHMAMGGRGHGWMMIACCIPMLVIAAVLVATGVASPGFIFVALACAAMMAFMHLGMGHGGDGNAGPPAGPGGHGPR